MGHKSVAIIGAGPVGGILTTYLVEGGVQPTVVDIWKDHTAAIRKDGLIIEGVESKTAQIENVYDSMLELIDQKLRFDIVVVCVKTTINHDVMPTVPEILAEGGTAISMQNGLYTEKGLCEVLPPAQVLRGVVNYAGNMIGPGRIKMTFFNPPNYYGSAACGDEAGEARAREVAELVNGCGLATEYNPDIQSHVWEKVIRNAGLMPISALTNQNMAQVMASPYSLNLVENLLREAIAVGRAAGAKLDDDMFESSLAYYRNAGEHMPSMWGDIQAARQTEIAVLNKAVADKGDELGIPTPFNRAHADLVACVDEMSALKNK